jgi:hypothetical protein
MTHLAEWYTTHRELLAVRRGICILEARYTPPENSPDYIESPSVMATQRVTAMPADTRHRYIALLAREREIEAKHGPVTWLRAAVSDLFAHLPQRKRSLN